MRNTMNDQIIPATEEDLIYPDESSEFAPLTEELVESELDRLIEKGRKFERRKSIKAM